MTPVTLNGNAAPFYKLKYFFKTTMLQSIMTQYGFLLYRFQTMHALYLGFSFSVALSLN